MKSAFLQERENSLTLKSHHVHRGKMLCACVKETIFGAKKPINSHHSHSTNNKPLAISFTHAIEESLK